MSVVDRFGVRLELAMRERIDLYENEPVERVRSLEMAARIRLGWPVAKVARYFNVHRTTVWRRVRSVPAEAAEGAARVVG